MMTSMYRGSCCSNFSLASFLSAVLGVFLSVTFGVLRRTPLAVLILLLIYADQSLDLYNAEDYRQTHLHPAPHRP